MRRFGHRRPPGRRPTVNPVDGSVSNSSSAELSFQFGSTMSKGDSAPSSTTSSAGSIGSISSVCSARVARSASTRSRMARSRSRSPSSRVEPMSRMVWHRPAATIESQRPWLSSTFSFGRVRTSSTAWSNDGTTFSRRRNSASIVSAAPSRASTSTGSFGVAHSRASSNENSPTSNRSSSNRMSTISASLWVASARPPISRPSSSQVPPLPRSPVRARYPDFSVPASSLSTSGIVKLSREPCRATRGLQKE